MLHTEFVAALQDTPAVQHCGNPVPVESSDPDRGIYGR
jgi:hypothetical protein